ncbi:MAG: nicotinate-nucleotide adenylyltransferase [Desulfobacterales bacterium]
MNRIGLFGGTFNPIHLGHLRSAQEVLEAFHLQRILLIPSSFPPHKQPDVLASAADRLAMIRLATLAHTGFSVSNVETKRQGPSYTIDTVKFFKGELPSDTRLFLVVGLDAFLEIDLWKACRDLFVLTPFIVMIRPEAAVGTRMQTFKRVEALLQGAISPSYAFRPAPDRIEAADFQPVYFMDVTPLHISSTRIRAVLRQGRSIRYLVPERVEAYIKRRGLYQ